MLPQVNDPIISGLIGSVIQKQLSLFFANDLDCTLSEMLAGRQVSIPITNPIGCSIKWEGNDKHWMPDEACDLV